MKTFEITASSDINPRIAMEITQFVEKKGINAFMSIEKAESRTVDMGSIIGLLSSGLKKGDRIKVTVEERQDTISPDSFRKLFGEDE